MVLVENHGLLPLGGRNAWRSSGRSLTARATFSATTATWSTSRHCARCGPAPTPWGWSAMASSSNRSMNSRGGGPSSRPSARRWSGPRSDTHVGPDLGRDRRRAGRCRRTRSRLRRGDLGPRRALRTHRRFDDRRVPRPLHARVYGPAAGAARSGRRDRHPGRAGARQRAAAIDRVGGHPLRGGPARVGPGRRRSGRDRCRPRPGPSTRAASYRFRSRATSARCR